jgi:phage/plasmid primase-like uncharacterized protein
MREELTQYLNEFRGIGYEIEQFNTDGEWHSFKVDSENHKKSGRYRVHVLDELIRLELQNFKDRSFDRIIEVALKELTEDEKAILRKKMEDDRAKKKAHDDIRYRTIAIQAQEDWARGQEDLKHPYLLKKRLRATYGSRSYMGWLYLPFYDMDGFLWGYQSVNEDGTKKVNYSKARRSGVFHRIGEIDFTKPLFICEGFATAATIFEATGHPAICTYGKDKLKEVAVLFRQRYPSLQLIISGDADEGGVKYSKLAARAAGARYLIPRFKHQHPDLTDWNDLREYEGEGTVKMQVENLNEARQVGNEKQDYIADWMKNHGVDCAYDGEITIDGDESDFEDLQDQIYLNGLDDQVVLPERLLKSYLHNWIREKKKAEFERITNPLLEYEPNTELERFALAMISHPSEADLAVLRHFLWQVKRKILRKKVEHHMMPVFSGKTRAGKSEGIRKLIAPLECLQTENGLSIFSDSREFNIFYEYLVIYMDEMEKADKADLNSVKRIISSEKVQHRILGMNAHKTGRTKATFIGSTNDRLVNLIKDPNSVRRFYEIMTKDKADWDEINAIDYLKVWRSVDAEAKCPILAYLPQIEAHQAKTKYTTEVEDWMKESKIERSIEGIYKIKSSDLYKLYCTWCDETNSILKRSQKFFSMELERLGVVKTEEAKGNYWHLKVPGF